MCKRKVEPEALKCIQCLLYRDQVAESYASRICFEPMNRNLCYCFIFFLTRFVRKFCIPIYSNHNIKESLSAKGENWRDMK